MKALTGGTATRPTIAIFASDKGPGDAERASIMSQAGTYFARRGARIVCLAEGRSVAIPLITSARAEAADMNEAMRWAREAACQIVDPHTAIALHAARAADLPPEVPVVTLATAHPAKFPDAVERATGQRPQLPARIGDLFAREERYDELPGDYAAVCAYIAERATPAA